MKIGLFIPCYVDVVYPQVGVATYKLLTHLGLDVDYPLNQTCCGQPMANAGFEKQAIPLAEKFEERFKGYDYIVAPSVSCTAFVKLNYPRLLKGKHECTSSGKIMDVVEFLHDVVKVNRPLGKFPHKVSLHNSCHGVRELGLSSPSEENVPKFNKIKDLLQLVEGIEIVEPERPDECCGFGGMFSVEETAISADGQGQGGTPYPDGGRVCDWSRLFLPDAHGRRGEERRHEHRIQARCRDHGRRTLMSEK